MSARRAIPIVLALLAGACSSAATAPAAAPRLLMVSGPGLSAPVTLTDWNEIADFEQAVVNESAPTDRSALVDCASLRVALFWNAPLWEPYIRQGKVASLRPDDANQFGRFYPASGRRPAAIDLPGVGLWPKVPNARALAILKRHGVPVVLGGGSGGTGWWSALAAAVALFLSAAAAAMLYRRRTRAKSVTNLSHGDSP